MKKLLSIALVVVLLAGIAVSGTMAYLTAEDSDVNVMTLGNVEIDQIELERKEQSDDNVTSANLKKFSQAKPLYPAVGTLDWADDYQEWATGGSNQLFTADLKNVQDKFVFVENTGKSDAYVRTFVAFEQGSMTEEEFEAAVGYNINDSFWTWETVGYGVKIKDADGVEGTYAIKVATYKGNADGTVHKDGILPAGETTRPSLLQVLLYSTATNEDVAKLDGNGNDTYDILVLSQAVQTNGFDNAQTALDTAFGVANAANAAEWFVGEDGTVEIPKLMGSFEDFTAVSGDSGNHVLSDDITLPNTGNNIYFRPGTDNVIDLNGKTLDGGKGDQYFFIVTGGSMHLKGEGTVNMGKGFLASGDNAEIIIDGGTYNATNTYTLNSIKHCSLAQNGGQIVINGGTFTTDVEDAVLFFATSNARIEINGGFFENTADETPDLLGIGRNNSNTNRIIITGGTFVNYNPLNDRMCYTGAWPAAGEAAFGGPWILIPGGYKVVSETQTNGDIWYTVVPE